MDGQYYSARSDLDLMFGPHNVDRWADPNNNGNQVLVTKRVEWANRQAYFYVNGRLMRGRYTVPFLQPYPQMIKSIASAYAGLYLYNTRRIVAGDTDSRVGAHKRDADMWIRQIVSGQLKVLDDCGVEADYKNAYPIASGKATTFDNNELYEPDPFWLDV